MTSSFLTLGRLYLRRTPNGYDSPALVYINAKTRVIYMTTLKQSRSLSTAMSVAPWGPGM
jgi:hypothetical protein